MGEDRRPVPPLFDHALLLCWATQANQHIIQSGSLVISQNTMAPMASMAAGPMTT